MNPVLTTIRILSTLVSLYATACMVRIIFTWIPQANSSKFGNFLANLCDPYLNLFRGIKWMRFGNFDFSPAIALCVLGAVATVLGSFTSGTFSLSHLLQLIVGLVWNIVNSILGFLTILLAIRLVILLVNKNSYSSNPILNALDSMISPMVTRISRTFSGNKRTSYKSQIIVTIVVFIVLMIFGTFVVSQVCNLIGLIRI